MFNLYRQACQRLDQQRQEASQAAWALVRAEPWRCVTLPISLALALFLEWALEWSGEHSPMFWWLTAFGVSAVLLGSVHLSLYVWARWERQSAPPLKEDQ
jgi:hypothetical protein